MCLVLFKRVYNKHIFKIANWRFPGAAFLFDVGPGTIFAWEFLRDVAAYTDLAVCQRLGFLLWKILRMRPDASGCVRMRLEILGGCVVDASW